MQKNKGRSRITGVVAKIHRVRASPQAAADYLLDAKADLEKLFCTPWIRNIPLPRKQLEPQELSKCVVKELERLIKPLETRRSPLVEIIISLPPDQAWSPPRWQDFWRRFLHNLSQVTYVTDHCVERQKEDGKRRMRTRPPRQFPVKLESYAAIVPIHDNTASQHLQALLCLVDPVYRQVAEINHGFPKMAVQWAARATERETGLIPHPKMPDYCRLAKGGQWYVVDERNILRVGNTFRFKERRELDAEEESDVEELSESATMSEVMRGRRPAVSRIREILNGYTPGAFPSLESLQEHLKSHHACLFHPKKGPGLLFIVQGSAVKPSDVGSAWLSRRILEHWPALKKPESMLGMSRTEQRQNLVRTHHARLRAANLSPTGSTKQTVADLLTKAQEVTDKFPWETFLVEERRADGSSLRRGKLSPFDLNKVIRQLFDPETCSLTSSLFFRPALPPDKLSLPLWDLTRTRVNQLCRDYRVSVVEQTQPEKYCALILLDVPDKEDWQNKLALRRLTLLLAARYGAKPRIVSSDGIPLPGLPQMAGAGYVPTLLQAVRGRACPKASRLLRKVSDSLAAKESLWWQGEPGRVLQHPRALSLPRVYLEHVRVLARNPVRCGTLAEMNWRIAARMLRAHSYEEIAEMFAAVKKHCPELLPNAVDEILEEAHRFCSDHEVSLMKVLPPPAKAAHADGSRETSAPGTTAPAHWLPPSGHTAPEESLEYQPGVVEEPSSAPELVIASAVDWIFTKVGQIAERFQPTPRPEQGAELVPELAIGNALNTVCTKLGQFVDFVKHLHPSRPKPSRSIPSAVFAAQCGSEIISIIEQIKRKRNPEPAAYEPGVLEESQRCPPSMMSQPRQPTSHCPRANSEARQTSAGEEKAISPTAPAPPVNVPPAEDEEIDRRKARERSLRLQMRAALLALSGDVRGAERLLNREGLDPASILMLARVVVSVTKEHHLERMDEVLKWAQSYDTKHPDWLEDALKLELSKTGGDVDLVPQQRAR